MPIPLTDPFLTVEVRTIQVTGAAVSGATTWAMAPESPPDRPVVWNISLTLELGANNISIQGYGRNGNPLSGYTDSIVITRQ